jgi:hypothetical protein
MTEYERFGLVFTKTRVYKFGHRYNSRCCWLFYLFCSHKYQKIVNYFIFKLVKKKIKVPVLLPKNCH